MNELLTCGTSCKETWYDATSMLRYLGGGNRTLIDKYRLREGNHFSGNFDLSSLYDRRITNTTPRELSRELPGDMLLVENINDIDLR